MNRYILLLFLGLTCSLSAQVIEIKNVQYCNQKKTEWCSAAVSQCVLLYRGIAKGQCDIMEYIMTVNNPNGPPAGCCAPDPNLCNKGVPLGSVDGQPASVYGILKHFGNFHHILRGQPDPMINEIVFDLQQKSPIIAKWDYKNPSPGDPVAHVVLIYGMNRDNIKDSIYYMDPAPTDQNGGLRRLPYNEFKDNSEFKWEHSLTYGGCFDAWKGDYPCPCHCYNNRWDPEYGETGVDCGYPCPPCTYPPPNPSEICSDCIHGGYESGIDCGGPCPPCIDLPEELIIQSSDQLTSEVMALKKITTKTSSYSGNNITVKSGQKVSFITEEEGTIVLRPGFKAVQGCTFITQRKDLSEYMRDCPEKFCTIQHYPQTHCTRTNYPYNRPLDIVRLYYAVEIKYKIYNGNGVVLDRVKKILNNGNIYLWDCQDYANGAVSYTMDYTVTYCNDTKKNYIHHFTVYDSFLQFSPPNSNNITHQDENVTHTFTILPNPNSGTFQLETNFPLSDIENLKITNTIGVTVYESLHLVSSEIQLQNSAPGLYFVVMVLKNGTVLTQKVMVQR